METRRRGAAGSLYTALSDVQAVADLFAQVLCTISENRGLVSWEKFVTYAAAEWYRSRIAFRKHTPRLFREVRTTASSLSDERARF